MVEENLSEKFRLKNIDGTRNYFLEETKQKELMSTNCKKVCTTLNYVEHFFVDLPYFSFHNYCMFLNF